MAPMIETPFAMKKFRGAGRRVCANREDIEWIINAETITCHQRRNGIASVEIPPPIPTRTPHFFAFFAISIDCLRIFSPLTAVLSNPIDAV